MFAIDKGIDALIQGGGIILSATLALSICILIWNKQFRKWLQSLGIETMTNRARIEAEERRLSIKTRRATEEAERDGSGI